MSILKVSDEGSESMARLASTWILLFTGFLVLYVPDRPFDPALRPMIERDRHQKRRNDLQGKLKALQGFERIFTGQVTSLRIQLVEQQLRALGDEPSVTAIVRPRVSALGQLQGEFNNIHKSIISRSPSASTLQLHIDGSVQASQEIELLRSNIAQAIARLSDDYRAYDDITKPLVAMLRGLDVGLAITLLLATSRNNHDDEMQWICKSTPFLGMHPDYLSVETLDDLDNGQNEYVDKRQFILQGLAAAQSFDHGLGEVSERALFKAFHTFYEDWKERLREDQGKEMARSSMYRYRGGEEDNEKDDEKEFFSLFPNYEAGGLEGSNTVNRKDSPKMLAQHLASYHRDIFKNCGSTSYDLLKMLQNASDSIARLWQNDSVMSRCAVPTADMMSGFILNLSKAVEYLQGPSGAGKLYNFYLDANLVEARRLIDLVKKVRSRFNDLRDAWPEHATIHEVLRTSSELLELRHTEPIAKIMTKAEQVHGFIHEWQVVASRQYSAALIYDQLTALLVDWRRLELSTWARLLDMEDKKCDEDANSWWFIAYEVIIAAPLSLLSSGTVLQAYAEQLFTTLGEFLATTSQGQFSKRILLLECFVGHLRLLMKGLPAMKVVHATITNILGYYKHFEKSIGDLLHKGRHQIEKDMKEVLLLASWKDTNIVALRDSAKRSHQKLFKIIRKYRALLTQSVQSMIAQGIPERPDLLKLSSLEVYQGPSITFDSRPLDICRQHIKAWHTKPARFTKPLITAENMYFMTRVPSTTIGAASLVEAFANDLIDTIKVLQKETPPTMTKDNGGLVKHLKSRKRKFFAGTLKELRKMGFRSNLGTDVLAKQASLSTVLANIPALDNNSLGNDFSTAEYYFHKVLSIIPQAKEHYRNHSNDLSPGEFTRSIRYLESILSVILGQRTTSISCCQDLRSLDQTVHKMRNLWVPDSYMLKYSQQSCEPYVRSVKRAVQWLPAVLDAGCVIIEKHGKLGGSGSHSTRILEGLQSWATKMANVLKMYETLPDLPTHVSSSVHEQTYEKAHKSLEEICHDLQKWTAEAPHIAFVLKQIELWTETTQFPSDVYMNGEHPVNLEQLDNDVSKAVDSILVAVQSIERFRSSMPSSHQDAGWLCRTDASLADSLKRSRMRDITSLFEDAMLKIQCIQTADGRGLQVAGAVFAMALPIAQKYHDIQKEALDRYVRLHRCTCRLASVLAQSFSQIASEGFCMPSDKSAAEDGKSERLEEGTGLGEGEGAENISKDIQDDEDLSELAREGQKSEDKEEIEDQDDAVNMDHDELEGELGDAPDEEDGSASGSDGEENDMDEETGDVDDLDPSTVDEKLWDGSKEEDTEKEKEGSKGPSEKRRDEQIAAEDSQRENPNTEETGSDDGISREGADAYEEVAREELENVDPHLQEEQTLDLPEEMDLDRDNDSKAMSGPDDSDLDKLSDVDQNEAEQNETDAINEDEDGTKEAELEEKQDQPDLSQDGIEEDAAVKGTEDAGSPVDTEPEDDEQDLDGFLCNKSPDVAADPDDTAAGDAPVVGEDTKQQEEQDKTQDNRSQGSKGAKGTSSAQDDPQAFAEEGQLGEAQENPDSANGDDEGSDETSGSQALKKLGDALEKWHRQRRQIRDAPDSVKDQKPNKPEIQEAEQEFEHLYDEAAEADTQALGAATEDQAHTLDERALDSEMQAQSHDFLPDKVDTHQAEDYDDVMQDVVTQPETLKNDKEQSGLGAVVGPDAEERQLHEIHGADALDEKDINDLDNDLSGTHLQPDLTTTPRTPEEARRLWFHYENLTRALSLSLTEQLRLTLAPTLATKMRGDFRTGKRLNIKRIIPYIASQYKRDKIWMRRSVPSKRNYQIMLAVDNSKSMGESGSGHLAFETLALVAKSLSMLEVGEICIVGFGDSITVVHDFDKPFSSDAGVQIFQHFTFQQTSTNVRKLVAESISLFRGARAKSRNAGADLWRLELIISDGVCEDHEGIRRLVRQAQEEWIMIVFVIVDALRGESIMDMSQAVFESVEGGESKLRIKRYLDGFPFGYYLVVGDVGELPAVLATALRQWFAEVAETG